MHLTWVLNNICTNSCSYCSPNLYAGKNHHYEWDHTSVFLDELFKRYPKIRCSISGGEPSVSPFLPELVKKFYDAGHAISLTTNGAKPVTYWTKLAPYVNALCFSYHPETPDPLFTAKVTEAAKLTSTSVRVMMHPKYWDHCVEQCNIFSQSGTMFVNPVRILDRLDKLDPQLYTYSQEQLQWLNRYQSKPVMTDVVLKNSLINEKVTVQFEDGTIRAPDIPRYINSGMTNFNGYTCYIGLRSLFLNFNGDIKRGNCNVGGMIGNINDLKNIKWPAAPVICTDDICGCGTDVRIPKHI